jgi:Transglycosylase SLT domain
MRRLTLLLSLLALPVTHARADFALPSAQPGLQCRSAIAFTERGSRIPEHLLAAIGRVESGRRDPQNGNWSPWPWTINAEGEGFFYETKAQAIAAVRALQARGVRSIDVGCMQVNLMHHPDAFATLEQAFDPRSNAVYAAKFLNQLYDQTGNWASAAALYHSATPELGADYQRRVLAVWPEEKKQQQLVLPALQRATLADAWAASLSPVSPASTNRVVVTLPRNRADEIRIIPLNPYGSPGTQGRGLDSYRAAPVPIASRAYRAHG